VNSRANLFTRIRFLILLCMAIACPPAYSGTFGPTTGVPLKTDEIRGLGKSDPKGMTYSGDLIFRNDILIQSGIVANRWPQGIIYFETDGTVDSTQREAFIRACQAWANVSPVKCLPRTSEQYYVVVSTHNGEACGGQKWVSCSELGMTKKDGGQGLYVFSGHWGSQYVLQHEIGHAFGLIHEQQRTDRDAFVTILWGNIADQNRGQFRTIATATTTDYDFDSIMHYDNCQFSIRSCDTSSPTEATAAIFPKACNRDLVGGKSMTPLDADGLRSAYLNQIAGLFSSSRRSECGVHNLSPQQAKLTCGENCSQLSPVSYNKIDDFHHEECSGGFVTDPPNFRRCPALKVLLSSHHNSSSFACGTGDTRTKYYWDWSCGCAKQSLDKMCSDITSSFNEAFLEKLRNSSDPKDIATARYVDVVRGWEKLGFVEKDTVKDIGHLIEKNYLDDAFRERLFAALYKMRVFIEAYLYVNKSYVLPHSTFLKIIKQQNLSL